MAALDSSRFFILLASPESARSGWVNREVEWWWNHRGAEGLLIVLTGGRLPWSAPDEPGDLALPPVLIENLVEDPLWVDLRWASGTEHVSSRNPRFREAVARLGASICERPLDEIIGEDVRRHRQTQRITRLAVTLLIALTITALIAARLAYLARDDAREQARIATARQLIAESSLRLSHRLDQAQLLAAAAYQVQPSTASRQALFAAAYASPYLHRFATQDGVVSSLAVSKNGRTVYVGESDGQLASLGFDSGKRIDLPCLPHLVNTLKLSDDEGALVAGSDHGEVELIDVATRTARQLPSMGSAPVLGVAINADRRFVVAVDGHQIVVYSTGRARIIGRAKMTDPLATPTAVFFDRHGGLTVIYGEFGAERFRFPSVTPVPRSSTYAPEGAVGYSRSGFLTASSLGDVVGVGPTVEDGPGFRYPHARGWNTADVIAVTDDGRRVALADQQRVAVLDATDSPRARLPVGLTGTAGASLLSFDGSGDRLVSARGNVVALWDFTAVPATAEQLRLPGVGARPDEATLLADGQTLAYRDPKLAQYVLWDVRQRRVVTRLPAHDGDCFAGIEDCSVSIAISADRALATALGRHGLTVFRIGNGSATPSSTVPVNEATFRSVEFHDHRIIVKNTNEDSGDADDKVWFDIYTPSGSRLRRITIPADYSAQMLSLPGLSMIVVAAENGNVTFNSTVDGSSQLVHGPSPSNPYDQLFYSAASADGTTMALARDSGRVDVWDVSRRVVANTVEFDHRAFVRQLSNDGTLMLIEGTPTAIWSTRGGGHISDIPVQAIVHPDADSSLPLIFFSPDRDAMYAEFSDRRIFSWTMAEHELLQVLCARAGRDLSSSEWSTIMGTRPPDDLRCSR